MSYRRNNVSPAGADFWKQNLMKLHRKTLTKITKRLNFCRNEITDIGSIYQNISKDVLTNKLMIKNLSTQFENNHIDNNQIATQFDNQIGKNQIEKNFNLSPRGIREMLKLNNPIYEVTSAYGHFGRKPTDKGEFSWEKTDKTDLFKL